MSSSTSELKNVLFLFDHPGRPAFVPKGLKGEVHFSMPQDLFHDEYEHQFKNYGVNGDAVPLKKLTKLIPILADIPKFDLTIPKKLSKKGHFSIFNESHQYYAAILIQYLMECSAEEFISVSTSFSLELNTELFMYALSVAIIHRKDTGNLNLPSPVTYSPHFFLPAEVIQEALDRGAYATDPADREVELNYIDLPITASDHEAEQKLAYFREDIGINLHHFHWHLVYPFRVTGEKENQNIVNKDRRGELFYYMHHQIMARYDFERFCNRLLRTVPLRKTSDLIRNGYFPKLRSPYSGSNWPSRQSNTILSNVNRPDTGNIKLVYIDIHGQRLLNVIHSGVYYMDKELVPLDERTGIDVLGNLIEASSLSKNSTYYGSYHNSWHLLLASSHDPQNKHLENIGVLGDNRTAMRDPAFYEWHSNVNELFLEYSNTLPSYTKEQLDFEGVTITNFKIVTSANPKLNISQKLENEFITYKQINKVNMAYGLDVRVPGPLNVKFQHIQHQNFQYHIDVNNKGEKKSALVRIFLAPSTEENSAPFSDIDVPVTFDDQRRFFIELTKFQVELNAHGSTRIIEESTKSSVTIPFKQMFINIEEIMENMDKNPGKSQNLAYCGCGWPHYYLIPKGIEEGYPCHLFVMISDYEKDKVEEEVDTSENCSCEDNMRGVSFCGRKDKKYPDKQQMGYPFNRRAKNGVRSIHDFLTGNMKVTDVKITYKNIAVESEDPVPVDK